MARRKAADYTYKPYDSKFHPQNLIEQMSQQKLNVEIAAEWNISIGTFNRWRHEHTELEEAYQLGLAKFEAKFIQNVFNPMIRGELEGRHAFNSAIAIANNKLGWTRGTQGEQKVNNTQININNMSVDLNNKSKEDLIALIQKDMDYLIDNNVINVEVKQIDDTNQSNGEDT